MKIVIVCDVLGKENNGTTIAAMNLIRFLKSKGHTVKVICGDQDKKGEPDFFILNNYNFGKFINNYVSKVGVSLAKPDEEIILQAIEGADLVHIMVPLSLGLATCKLAKERNIPITAGFHMQAENLTSHFKLSEIAPLNLAVYKFIYKHLYVKVDAIHYPTQFIRDTFEKAIKRETVGYVISNGIGDTIVKREISKPEIYKDKVVLLSVGRLAREKSQDTLLKAIKYSKYKDRLQIVFAGLGPKEKKFKKMGSKLDNTPVINFFSREEINDLINYCDIYVHTADIELEGIALLEAVSCGKLCIVSDSKKSATRYFAVSDKCIFKKRNKKSLAKTIDYWIEHPEEKKEIEDKYLESSKHLSREECMQKMENMMLEVIKNKKSDV